MSFEKQLSSRDQGRCRGNGCYRYLITHLNRKCRWELGPQLELHLVLWYFITVVLTDLLFHLFPLAIMVALCRIKCVIWGEKNEPKARKKQFPYTNSVYAKWCNKRSITQFLDASAVHEMERGRKSNYRSLLPLLLDLRITSLNDPYLI